MSAAQVNRLQVDPTQVNSVQDNILEISNPLNLWSTLFDPTFNIDFQIQDLPTGQLAEAQLTQFDSEGRPNGRTLILDHNANGLGWFIDQTPWENELIGDSVE